MSKYITPNSREILYAQSTITGQPEYLTSTNHILNVSGGGGGGGAVTIADGADVTQGAIADAAVAAGASGTISAKLRRISTDIGNINTVVNSDGGVAGSTSILISGVDGSANAQTISTNTSGHVNIADGGNSITVDGTVTLGAGSAVIGAITNLIPGTGNTNLGSAVDAAAGATKVGVLAIGVRDDALATLTPVDNDYTEGLRVSSRGAVWTTIDGYLYGRATTDTQIKGSAGFIHTVSFAATGTVTPGVITIYDSTTESGTVIFSSTFPTTFTLFTVTLDVYATTGIYVGYDGSVANVQTTVSYR